MRAVVLPRYGGPEVLEVRKVPTPVPGDQDLLVRVRAAAVTMGDCEIRGFKMAATIWLPMRLATGVFRPRGAKVLGTDFAGVVEAVGAAVTRYRIGDRVFGTLGFRMGAHAEYVTIAEAGGGGSLAPMPAKLTFAEAAAAPLGGMMAEAFLEKGEVGPGKRVLIIGAGGSIGTFAVQAARNAGAHVTAVDNGHKLEMLRALGAERVVDFTRERVAADGARYDVIYSVAGSDTYADLMQMLAPGGIYLLANLRTVHMARGQWAGDGRTVRLVIQSESSEKLSRLSEALATGRLKAVVDRAFALEEAPAAHRYVEAGMKRGGIVLAPEGPDAAHAPG